LGPFGLAKAAVQSHKKKVPENVEKRVGVGFLGAEEIEVSLHGWCVRFAYVVANLFPSRHLIIDNLDGRGKCFGVRLQIAGVPVAAAGNESRRVEKVFFIGGDP
jgi:hypothetical protein